MGQKAFPPDETVKLPSTYSEIKKNPENYVVNNPKVLNRLENGIINPLFTMHSVLALHTNEVRFAKIYRKSELTPVLVKMLQHEIELLKKLDHPNIIRLVDLLEDETKIYVITDPVRGKSLWMHIFEKGELSESDASFISA